MSGALRLLRQPRWLVPLILLPFAMALCLMAANWQYGRHANRAAAEERMQASLGAAPVPLASVVGPGEALPADQQYARVSASGRYDTGQTTLIRNRSLNSEPGFWVTTPLQMADGTRMVVLRGWLRATGPASEPPEVPPAPAGEVNVVGLLQEPEPQRGSADPSRLTVTSLATSQICNDPGACLQPYLQLVESTPADPLTPLPATGPGLGPHLGYAGQWVLFAIMLPIGYVLLLRRELQDTEDSSGALTETL